MGNEEEPPLVRQPGRPALGFSPRYVAGDELTAAIDAAFNLSPVPIGELSSDLVHLKYYG